MQPVARPAATDEEFLEGLAVRHDAYGRTMPLATYQASRLACRREHRATPWILDRGDGTIVSTLLCHSFNLSIDGRIVPAYGLGSVGTRVAHRRAGHAATLCKAAIEANERSGRKAGLLYAGIAPAFYERMGFAVLPAVGFRCERLADLVASGPSATLVPFDPRRELDHLLADYATFHDGSLHTHRGRAAFLQSIDDAEDSWFLRVDGVDQGYLRVGTDDDGTVVLDEPILLDPSLLAPALRGVARLALDSGRKAIRGWIEAPEELRELVPPVPRTQNLPMLRGATARSTVALWPSDHF